MQSDSGWTDNELCEVWFRESFIPNVVARRVDVKKPIVLTFDGHESHETPAIKRLAYDNNIVLYCLPSKTTHKLQPLDVGVFSVLQRAWNKHSGNLAAKRTPVDRYNFIPEYLAVRKQVVTPDLIIKAFRKTGISPFNPDIFPDQEYGPSMASSSTLHLPSSYPDPIPSSPPATPTDDEDSDDDYIPECSSDMEMCSTGSDKDDPGDKGYEYKDNFGCAVSHDDPTTPLISDMFHTTPTENQHITDGMPLVHGSPISQLRGQPATSTPSEHLSFSFPDHPPAFSTRSHFSLTTLGPSVAFSKKPEWEKTVEQVLAQSYDVHRMLAHKEAELRATKAHCTIMAHALADANAQIDSLSKKKTRGTSKIKARWVALPELQDMFEAEEIARKEKERCDAEKEAQKQADDYARQSQIIKDTVLKVFDRPFSVHKRKDELIVLAGALELDKTGTIPALKERIKTYLNSHKDELMQNPRFMGLFQSRRQHAFDGESHDRELGGGAGPSGLM